MNDVRDERHVVPFANIDPAPAPGKLCPCLDRLADCRGQELAPLALLDALGPT